MTLALAFAAMVADEWLRERLGLVARRSNSTTRCEALALQAGPPRPQRLGDGAVVQPVEFAADRHAAGQAW